jgi:hypothetical protein
MSEWTVEYIIQRLEAAGKTELAMPAKGFSTGLAQQQWHIVRNWRTDYAGSEIPRAAIPSAGDISAMNEAYGWVLYIPDNLAAVRRVIYARSLVHPLNDRHLMSWRKIAEMMHTDHKAVQRMFIQGVKIIFERASQTPQKAA